MTTYTFKVEQIQNGWIFTTVLPDKPWVEQYYSTELEALVALQLASAALLELSSTELLNTTKENLNNGN